MDLEVNQIKIITIFVKTKTMKAEFNFKQKFIEIGVYMIIILANAFLCAAIVVFIHDVNNGTYKATEQVLTYNVEKDAMIQRKISAFVVTKKLKTDQLEYVDLRCNNIRIQIVHRFMIEFEQPETWNYFAWDKNGNSILIDKSCLSEQNKLSNQTYADLQKLCITILNKN